MEFDPGKELKITRYACVKEEDLDLSELVNLSMEQLKAKENISIEKEKELFSKIESGISEWQKQAKETIRLRKAQEYLRTLPVHHTFNQWVENANDWYELSNMVYKLTYHVSKNTFSRGNGKPPAVRYSLSWSLVFNTPRQPLDYQPGRKIAGQSDKRYMDAAEMERYLQGRIKAYSHLFTEISPPIPEKDKKHFCINGTLMPGYTIESPERLEPDNKEMEDLLSFLSDEDISDEAPELPPDPQPEEKTPEAVWSRNRQQRQRTGRTPQAPAR